MMLTVLILLPLVGALVTAFVPRGLAGHAYWAAVLPFHGIVFSGMARNIARGATAPPGTADPGPPATPRSPADSAR